MSYIVVDVESDGPILGVHSMVCFGAVVVEPTLSKTFYGKTRPISDIFIPERLSVSGFSRDEHLKFDDPKMVMTEFSKWIEQSTIGKPILISDNNGFDAAWINNYFWSFLGYNPFGWSSRRIGDIWSGFNNDMFVKWKYLRKTKHTHNPLNDALGNAEALLEMKSKGLNIKLK